MNSLELLNKCTLFSELDNDEIEELNNIARIRNVNKKSVLFLEGDPATGFFLLLSGSVRIYKSSPEGKEYAFKVGISLKFNKFYTGIGCACYIVVMHTHIYGLLFHPGLSAHMLRN